MDCAKNPEIISRRNFSTEFKIQKFKESTVPVKEYIIRGIEGNGVSFTVQGKGSLPKNEDYVIFCIKKLDGERVKYWPYFVVCTCMVCVLDVKGEKKFLRTTEFLFRSKDFRNSTVHSNSHVEERYVERNAILNNESEYLQKDTLTVIVEGTKAEFAEWDRDPTVPLWVPSISIRNFRVEQFGKDLEVYLREDSTYAVNLKVHSKVFRDMWDAPMQESKEERVLIRNEELPAFLCMLFFMESGRLLLHEATIFDVYKIAHMYDIQMVLEECREYIRKYVCYSKNVSAILEFATYYSDIKLKGIAESFLNETHEDLAEAHKEFVETHDNNRDYGIANELNSNFICNTRPVCSNLIKSEGDFEKYLEKLWKKHKHFHKFIFSEFASHTKLLKREKYRESFDFYK